MRVEGIAEWRWKRLLEHGATPTSTTAWRGEGEWHRDPTCDAWAKAAVISPRDPVTPCPVCVPLAEHVAVSEESKGLADADYALSVLQSLFETVKGLEGVALDEVNLTRVARAWSVIQAGTQGFQTWPIGEALLESIAEKRALAWSRLREFLSEERVQRALLVAAGKESAGWLPRGRHVVFTEASSAALAWMCAQAWGVLRSGSKVVVEAPMRILVFLSLQGGEVVKVGETSDATLETALALWSPGDESALGSAAAALETAVRV